MWITSCPEAMGWRFWVIFEKMQLVEIWCWTKRIDFRALARPSQWVLRYAPRIAGIRWNSQHSKNSVSLSSCWKPKSQGGNKSFVPELPRVVSVSGFLCMWTFYVSEHVLRIRISVYFNIYVYFTNLGPILNTLHKIMTKHEWVEKWSTEKCAKIKIWSQFEIVYAQIKIRSWSWK